MILDYEYKNKKLIVSYINDKGEVKLKYYDWDEPYNYQLTSDVDPERHPKYKTWDGKNVKEKKADRPNKYAVYYFLDQQKEDEKLLFDYHEPNIFFVDIENEIDYDGKIAPHLAKTKIQTISIVNKNKALVMGFDYLEPEKIEKIKNDLNNEYGKKLNKEFDFKYIQYRDEYEMLYNFFYKYVPNMPVVSGWNFDDYDWIYLCYRSIKLGIDIEVASYTKKFRLGNKEANDYSMLPYHRLIIDYLKLYKKYDTAIKVKESQGLDFVSDKLLGLKKIKYDGSLKTLYDTDFPRFVYYNVIDSILVQGIHEKMQYINILYSIAVLSKITVSTALSTLAITEGYLRHKLLEKNIVLVKNDNNDEVVINDDVFDNIVGVKGGFVKDPTVGFSNWTACFDFSSLYPSVIREFNISSDSYKGQKLKNKHNIASLGGKHSPIEENDIITINDSVFKNEMGVVNEEIGNIFKKRKYFKNLQQEQHEKIDELEKEIAKLKLEVGE